MAEQLPIGADDVARKEFATVFRGFDQYEVRAYLGRVAAELAAVFERERLLRDRLASAEARALPKELDEAQLDALLGQEAGKVLQAAHAAAAEIRSRAEEQVARMVREAVEEGDRIRGEAETVLDRRTEEAEQVVAAMLADAEQRATAEVEAALARGREMVGEAQAVRERLLKDLARRRRVAHQQLEQLRAGRERLIEAYRVVRATLDEATGELTVAEAEARAAAEAASLRAADEEEPDLEALEAEVAAARQAGLTVPAPAEPAPAPTGELAEPAPAPTDEPAAATDTAPAPEPEAPAEPGGAAQAPVPVATSEPGPRPAEARPSASAGPDNGAAAGAPVEERRSSALRILRRRSERGPSRRPDVVAPGDDVEGVRVIPAGEGDAAGPVEPAGPEPVVDDAVTAPPAAGDTAEAEPAEPEGVDALFARLRADRAAAVAEAESVLEAGAGDEAAPDEAGPTEGDAGGTDERTAEVAAASDAATPAAGGGDAEPEQASDAEAADEPVPDADEVALQQRDADVEGLERSLARALKRALADDQNEILDSLRRLRGKPSLKALLPGDGGHAARYAATASPILHDAAHAGAKAFDGDPPDVDALVAELAEEVSADLQGRLARAIDESGGDEAGLAEAISAAYRQWKRSRAQRLARHHVVAAHAAGRFAAMPDGPLRWVVDPEEGSCPDCDDNGLAGDTQKGEAFPTGQLHPPAHAGCRCLVVAGG